MIDRLLSLRAKYRFFWAKRRAWRRYQQDRARNYPLIRHMFKSYHNYDLNLDRPRTHSERVNARKLFDHNPVYSEITDKYRVRAHIDSVLGDGAADKLMVPILARTTSFYDLPADIWQKDVILKCTHGSGMNCVVHAGDARALKNARRKVNRWLGKVHGARKLEWCYFDLTPGLIVEPLLPAVTDLKLFFYDGELRFIMPENNNSKVPTITIYTPDWQHLPYAFSNFDTAEWERPDWLDEIIQKATQLAAGFDMIRVDFLLTEDRFYLGELTLYDGSGMVAFSNYEDDLSFGRYWRQPHLGFDQGIET